MTTNPVQFEHSRFQAVLAALENMASGEVKAKAPVSPQGDELDALAYGINVLAGELYYRLNELGQAQSNLVQSGKLMALGELSSGLAHELNNPLASIRGYVELSQELLVNSELSANATFVRYLSRIDENVERMSNIISYMMDFSRQSLQKREAIQIHQTIRRSFILLNEQLRLRSIEVRQQFDPADPRIIGDSVRLEQVMINLLNNARDAIAASTNHKAGGKIEIQTHASETEVEIRVSDNGVGMTSEVADKIFHPFFTTKEVGKGTGLGLSISLGIIEEHGGSITCQTELGEGTTMTIRLPVIRDHA